MTELEPSRRLQRYSRSAAGFFVGGLIGLIAAVIIWRTMFGQNVLPALTRHEWDESFRKWEAAGVRDYDIEIKVTGRQAATYAVQVRAGIPISAQRDGYALPQQRTWSTWTVEGMFETIGRDLESVEKHATGRAESGTPQLQLRGTFDPELGYPQRYLRTEMVKFGANPEVSWGVVRFINHTARAGD
jgi:hypothetical protein